MINFKTWYTSTSYLFAQTSRIWSYQNTATLGGGSIVKPVKTSRVSGITTPLLRQVMDTPTFGFYYIKLRESEKTPEFYYRIWVLSTD